MNRVEVVRPTEDLTQEKWTFWYHDRSHALVLDTYEIFARKTKRHGWKTVHEYRRIQRRGTYLIERDVPVPAEVWEEARKRFIDGLRLVKWSELL